jgi:flagellar motility protein MotE (MotC chaperone)
VKKLIITCQIIFVALFLIKALSYTDLIQGSSFSTLVSWNDWDQAIAQTPTPAVMKAPPASPLKDVTEDGLQKERDLLTLLQKKQKELDTRESTLKAEEQKIAALKKEVMDKMDALKSMETQLSAKLDTEKTQDEKRLKDLAKVYEATPPQKAAAMLEKLDVKTAAGITINMKRDRAGLIWGFLAPQKAVEITNEITKTVHRSTD